MRILGVIPARGGSKAIPEKNLVELGGKPLIKWTLDAASASTLERVVVSTDDEKIAAYCVEHGTEVPFRRPKELSTDGAQTIDAVIHALDFLDEEFDAVMLLQPTTPFRSAEDIDQCVQMLTSSDANSVISVVDVAGHHPARMKFLEHGLLVDPPFAEVVENQPRQELRPMFIRNGAVYLTRVRTLRMRSFKGQKCLGFVMPAERSVNIDDMNDLKIARAMLP
jgi:CMP-N-acetylneuraminic acid synthetase